MNIVSAPYAAPKAGMEKNDAIQSIIAELSSDKYTKDTGEKAAWELKSKVEAAAVTRDIQVHAERTITSLNNKRKPRICVVVDFDMFYAAVELLTHPHLANKAVAIAGGNGDTMVTTANYVARQYGVRSGMPLFIARQLCKRAAEFGKEPVSLEVLSQDKPKQQQLSSVAMGIFRTYDPTMVTNSPDEAKLELGPYLQETYGELSFSKAETVVQDIRAKVQASTGLTASAGIASNFLLAKVASDFNKPNGQFSVKDEDIDTFLVSLPIRKMDGIGAKTETKLRVAFGVTTCGEMRAKLPEIFAVGFDAEKLLRLSIGWSEEANQPPAPQKSMSQSRTFRPTADKAVLATIVGQLCEQLAAQMAKDRVFAQTAALRWETSSFLPCTKTAAFKNVRSAAELKLALAPLLPDTAVRMLSVTVTRLQPVPKRTLDQFLLKPKA